MNGRAVHVDGSVTHGTPHRVEVHDFPSTRYQGSKRKIVPWIWDNLRELDFSSALDVFGGSASVSYLFKRMGKTVTYNDYLHFNHYIGLALIENDEVTLEPSEIEFVLSRAPKLERRVICDIFRGVYFTDEENLWLDNAVAQIAALKARPSASAYKRALLYYALFQSCLVKRPFNLFHRRNLYLRFRRVKRSFGNKTTWDTPFSEHFAAFCREVNRWVFKGAKSCRSICHDALDIPAHNYDLVYIDPPYVKDARRWDHPNYHNWYHFLEGLCTYSKWPELIDFNSPNLRMKPERSNDWIDRDNHSKAFDALFEKYAKSIIVVSYKKFGVPSIDTLVRMLKRHGRKVRSHSRHYKYALNHQNGEAKLNREFLLVAE